ncbi:MAG: glycosyltransferase [Myxococcales bacterium]|nr:glycosyltransferase [Myxococcales bacterium]
MSAKKRVKVRKRAPRRAPAVTSGRPLLSLAMMVKDEEDFLADALRSARGWCDELVVVDTGSTDRTVEIARDLGAQVSFFPWCDSFSKARNETLKRATGRYVAILDADERFVGRHPEAIRPHLRPGPQHPYEALSVQVTNTRLDGSPISSFFSVRFFANDGHLGYSGRVHNRFGALKPGAPKVSVTKYLGLEVVHLGYDPDLYALRKKAARSLPLIEATVREEPDNLHYRYYLGREYLLLARVDDAIAVLEPTARALLKAPGSGPLAETVTTLTQAYEAAGGHPEQALKLGQAALAHAPTHPDVWFGVARALAALGHADPAAQAAERALAALGQVHDAQVQLGHRRWEAHELLGKLYWQLQRFPDAYRHDLATLEGKPADAPGWPVLLNSLCALAIELGDGERVAPLLERLLAHPEAPLGMFFFQLQRVAGAEGAEAARRMLQDAAARHPRVTADAEYAPWAQRLGVT